MMVRYMYSIDYYCIFISKDDVTLYWINHDNTSYNIIRYIVKNKNMMNHDKIIYDRLYAIVSPL